jgi:hypothetical protein
MELHQLKPAKGATHKKRESEEGLVPVMKDGLSRKQGQRSRGTLAESGLKVDRCASPAYSEAWI